MASQSHFRINHPEMTKKQWIAAAEEECFEESPYGRRYAINQLNRPDSDFTPMREFTRYDEERFIHAIRCACARAANSNNPWSFLEEGQVEMRLVENWNQFYNSISIIIHSNNQELNWINI